MNLTTKYRPTKLDAVIGQRAVCQSLQRMTEKGFPHAILFHGESGTGKTTFARIIAILLEADEAGILEINGADRTGVDAWRKQIGELQHLPQVGPVKVVIVDECHALSPASWKVLLKPIEDPPSHVYWIFCTTESAKLPAVLVTRCTEFALRRVSPDDLGDLIERVAIAEGIWEHAQRSSWLCEVVTYAAGSPRQALSGLEAAAGATDIAGVRALLVRTRPPPEVIELCRGLVANRLEWAGIIQAVRRLDAMTDPESVRRSLIAYTTRVLLDKRTPSGSMTNLLNILEWFGEPYLDRKTLAPLLVSLGKLKFNG